MQNSDADFWKKCSSCKKPIGFSKKYYVCSVSTCNGERTGYVFCTVLCFERHVPGARHRDAAAIEMTAPSSSSTHQASSAPRRIVAGPSAGSVNLDSAQVLVIASRLKDYIQDRSDFNTSADVMSVLSDQLRILCDRAIDNARAAGRKTVMARDFDFLKNKA